MEPFGARQPTVRVDLCLNTRHRQAGCTRCTDICPVDALPQPQGVPMLDADACVACGACVAICPTDAVSQLRRPEGVLLETLDRLPPAPLLLACPLAPAAAGQPTAAPVAGVVRHARCLAALDAADLLHAGGYGQRTLWLDDVPCTSCPIGQLQTAIHAGVRAANTFLAAYGHTARLLTSSLDARFLTDPPQPRPVVDGMQPRLSRRELFRSLGRAARERLDAATEEELPMILPGAPVEMRLPKQLPGSRRRLLEALQHLAADPGPDHWAEAIPTRDLPLAAVDVDPAACSGCSLCARFCPTEALIYIGPGPTASLKPGEQASFQLAFRAGLCIDCAICAVACPDDAVHYGPELPPAEILDEEWTLLVEGELVPCVVCGAATAPRPTDSEPRCYACRGGAGVVRPLQDGAGLLDDLRRRLGIGGVDNESD